ncbi:N-methyl-L-tryptophan oxidase [Acidisphaera rubrifaciens]|uniref:N-methyltryptophan oxidase n=1 Tax=Acidisphaera rubrifaciens HS-AP3 TaxID=1231350 RepID=A0A0D6PBD8_9PROT|nr:N-methyl-L-tryptophan oxidase [Acidisphaera rubrifaciens]GAN78523.1 N-methyltryptophan oxidase [Acidisphaera rubrifaciens HS-AP3]
MGHDTIVVGMGAMGSAAAWQLARRGHSVLGLERFDIPHDRGSHHGVTRIIRLPYYEDPAYVPLLRRAYALWREIEAASGEALLHITGSLDGGPADGALFAGALRSARLHDLPHEVLTGAEVARRFPAYALPDASRFVFQPDGGFLASERAVLAHVRAAQEAGADIRARVRVHDWATTPGGGVRVRTDQGSFEAATLILAAGAWMADLLPDLRGLAVPERQVLAWLQPRTPALFTPARFPVFNIEVAEGRYYGLPVFEVPGFKFGRYHHRGEAGPADAVRRAPDAADEALLRGFAERYFPTGCGPTMALRDCLFTNTPDEHFIIDRHPQARQIIVASPCSGHGFKFASVIGEILAEMAIGDGRTRHEIGFLRLDRPGLRPG